MDTEPLVQTIFAPALILIFLFFFELIRVIQLPKKDTRIEAINHKIRELKIEERKLDSVDTFVQASRVRRKIATLEGERDKITATQQEQAEPSPYLFYIKQSFIAISIAFFWNAHIVTFSQPFFGSPVHWLLAFPGHPPQVIGIVAWVIICDAIVKRFLQIWVP